LALSKNTVGSKQLKPSAVKTADIHKDAVNSTKVANGSLLGEDFAAGQLPQGLEGPQGPQGVEGLPGTARAFGRVARSGVLTRSKNATVVQHVSFSGKYCIDIAASIDASSTVLVATADFNDDNTSFAGTNGDDQTIVEVAADTGAPCATAGGDFLVLTGTQSYTGGTLNGNNAEDAAFMFVVP
jgi:hypothetical protein